MNELRVILVYEDELSGAVLRKLLTASNKHLIIGREVHTRGFGRMKKDIRKYQEASYVLPHVVLTDLDVFECPPALIAEWKLHSVQGRLIFRIAVREVEAWLLADRSGFAEFLGLPESKIPSAPETLEDPKQTLINLARRIKRRRLAEEIIPPAGSTSSIGPFYNDRLSEFVTMKWNVQSASERSPSLAKALNRIQELNGS